MQESLIIIGGVIRLCSDDGCTGVLYAPAIIDHYEEIPFLPKSQKLPLRTNGCERGQLLPFLYWKMEP